MDLIWDDSLWPICGFYMVLLWYCTLPSIMKHISLLVLTSHCLFYGKDTYFVKIHTVPIYGINMRYGNGMGAEMKSIHGKDMGYGNSLGAPYHSLIYGKATYFVKIHTVPIHWIGMGSTPTSIPYCSIPIP